MTTATTFYFGGVSYLDDIDTVVKRFNNPSDGCFDANGTIDEAVKKGTTGYIMKVEVCMTPIATIRKCDSPHSDKLEIEIHDADEAGVASDSPQTLSLEQWEAMK